MSDYWIRCNVCAAKPGAPHPLSLLTCKHIVCRRCLQDDQARGSLKCPVCKASPVRSLEMGRDAVPIHLQPMFDHPSKAMKQMNEALNFQYGQQIVLISALVKDNDQLKRMIHEKHQVEEQLQLEMDNMRQVSDDQKREIEELKIKLAASTRGRISPSPQGIRGYVTSPPVSSSRFMLNKARRVSSPPPSAAGAVDRGSRAHQPYFFSPPHGNFGMTTADNFAMDFKTPDWKRRLF